jgi:hypothetical protein
MKKLIAAALFVGSMALAPTGASAGLASSPAALNADAGTVNVDQVRWGGHRRGGWGHRHHSWGYGYGPRRHYYGAYAWGPRFGYRHHRHFRHW